MDPGRELEPKPNDLGRSAREGERPVGAGEGKQGDPEYYGTR